MKGKEFLIIFLTIAFMASAVLFMNYGVAAAPIILTGAILGTIWGYLY